MKLTTIALATAATCSVLIGSAGFAADGRSWAVEATSKFAGPMKVQFSGQAFRIDLEKLGLTIATHAPSWEAFLYSDQNKKYIEVPRNKWAERFRLLMGGKKRSVEAKIRSTSTGKSKNLFGVRAEQFTIVDQASTTKPAPYIDLWATKQITPPSELGVLLTQMLGIPKNKGLPLIVKQCGGPSAVTIYETEKLVPASVSATVFNLPKGMKKVEDEMQLIMDESDFDSGSGASAERQSGDAVREPRRSSKGKGISR